MIMCSLLTALGSTHFNKSIPWPQVMGRKKRQPLAHRLYMIRGRQLLRYHFLVNFIFQTPFPIKDVNDLKLIYHGIEN